MTDDEIVKALEICYNSPSCCADCPYFNKHGRNFCVEDKALYKDLKRILQEHAEQKAEIERLTEENSNLKKLVKSLEDLKETLLQVKAELQKQVDELLTSRELAINELHEQHAIVTEEIKKDTAKEILSFVIDQYDGEYFLHNVEQFIVEKYGVEVE